MTAHRVYLVFAVQRDRYGFVIGDGAPTVVEVLANESSARTARSAYVNTALRVEEWEVGARSGRVLFDDIDRERTRDAQREDGEGA